MIIKKFSVFSFLFLLLFSFLSAQQRYGNLKGQVTFEDGSPMPGVAVTILGPKLMGTRSAVTDGQGRFAFFNLTVGSDYQLVFELEGFKKLTKEGILIALGKDTFLETQMEPGTPQEEVTVIATAPVVDKSSSVSQVNVSNTEITALPIDRRFRTIMEMMPGVRQSHNPEVGGGSSYDNAYLVDGMDTDDAVTKTWAYSLNFDNFEEMQVITSGAPAEYGRAYAVLNLVTKSGSNAFHGKLNVTMADTDWNAKMQGDRYYFYAPYIYLNQTRPSLSLGGPIIKDHIWFFGGYEKSSNWRPAVYYKDFTDWITDLTPTQMKRWEKANVPNLKISLRSGRLSGVVQFTHETRIRPPDGEGYETPSANIEYWWRGRLFSSELNYTLGPNTYLTGHFGLNWTDFNYNRSPHETGNIAYKRGPILYGSTWGFYESKRYQDVYSVVLNHIGDTKSLGYHDIKAGVEFLYVHMGDRWVDNPCGEFIELNYDPAATPMARSVYSPAMIPIAKMYNPLWTFYVQDKWQLIPNLTFNIGLRAEMGKWQNHDKQTIINWGLSKMIAPRLGAVYNLGDNKFNVNAGRFYDIMDFGIVSNFQPDKFGRTEYRYLGEYYTNPATGLPYQTWTLVETVIPFVSRNTTIDSKLGPQYMDEIGYGYERALGTRFSFSVSGLHRWFKNQIQSYDPYFFDYVQGGQFTHFYNETAWTDAGSHNWGKTYKRYDSLVFTFRKILAGDKYQFFSSYTLSSGRGFTGYTKARSLYDWVNNFGAVGLDSKHMIKFNGSIILPLDIIFGTSFYWASGVPYNQNATVLDLADPRQWSYNYNVNRPGTFRYPATWRLDFRAEKRFVIRNLGSISAYVDVFNVLNNQIEMSADYWLGDIVLNGPIGTSDFTVLTPNLNYGLFSQWFAPTSIMIGAKIEF